VGAGRGRGRPLTVTLLVRPRTDADIPPLVAHLSLVHERDGYPVRWPPGGGPDPVTTFVAPPGALAAWVVDDGAGPVGQAVLTPGHDAGSLGWAELTGLPVQHHAVVSRVFTAVTARGQGALRQLLAEAVREAEQRGLLAVLDVLDDHTGARAAYRRLGWRELGRGTFTFRDGTHQPMTYLLQPAG